MAYGRKSANNSKGINGYKLAKAIGECLRSRQAEETMREVFQLSEQPDKAPGLTPRARTARSWLSNMGLHYKRIGKGAYIDGHEREDVSQYRQ